MPYQIRNKKQGVTRNCSPFFRPKFHYTPTTRRCMNWAKLTTKGGSVLNAIGGSIINTIQQLIDSISNAL